MADAGGRTPPPPGPHTDGREPERREELAHVVGLGYSRAAASDTRGQPVPVLRQNRVRFARRASVLFGEAQAELRGGTASCPRPRTVRRGSQWGRRGRCRRTERGGGRRGLVAMRAGRDAGLRRPADVAMMQTADFRNLHDRAHLRPLDWPPIRAHPSGARGECVPGDSTRSSGSGCGAGGVRSGRGHDPDTRAGSSR